jgi:hypothetical protein
MTRIGATPVQAAGAIIKKQDLTPCYVSLQGAPPTLPQATNFPQAFQYYVDILIDRIPLLILKVSNGYIL